MDYVKNILETFKLFCFEKNYPKFVFQSQDEAVHLAQQYDQLRHRLGVQNQPGTAARTRGPCPPWILLPHVQQSQVRLRNVVFRNVLRNVLEKIVQ